MDFISNAVPLAVPAIQSDNYNSYFDQVYIKQELDDQAFEEEDSGNTLSLHKTGNVQTISDEIKIEGSEYSLLENVEPKINDTIQNIPRNVRETSLYVTRRSEDVLVLNGPNNEIIYGCKRCPFQTKHKVSLQRHVKLHSPGELTSYKCEYCGFETIYKRHFEKHVKVLHREANFIAEYKCDQCSYESNYRENLSRHKKIHLGADERTSFVCEICGFETIYRKSYRVHMEMIHQSITTAKNEEAEFKCHHCPFETKYRVNIVRHLKTHMKGDTRVYKCSDCDFRTIHKTNYNSHVLRHKDPSKIKIYECDHCSHKTYYKASLRNHLKLHMKKEQIETYKCDACDFDTIYERSLKLHVLYMHNSEHQAIEYFKCNYCSFETRYRENWRRHEKNHTKLGKQDTYNCAECSFSTIQQGRFERHMLVHTKPEPMLKREDKSESNKRFRSVIDVPNNSPHTLTYENEQFETDPDSFHCQTFTDGTSRELTMFKCTHCSYKTLNKVMLEAHLTGHVGISHRVIRTNEMEIDGVSKNDNSTLVTKNDDNSSKYFECDQCSFLTIHRSSMKRHKETHLRPNQRKVFKCPTCFFHSFTRATVNRHECPNRPQTIGEGCDNFQGVGVCNGFN